VADTATRKRSQNGSSGGGSDARSALNDQLGGLFSAVAGKLGETASNRLEGLTDKLTDIGSGEGAGTATKAVAKAGEKVAEGKSPAKAALSAAGEGIKDKVTNLFSGGGKGKGGKRLKVTNIIEQIDVGAPVSVVYNQWSQFQDFSGFMKKVDSVNQSEETKVEFKAQVFWSHRSWTGEILEQVPDRRIVWRSKGQKGHVDGAVTFHEIGPELTRVLVVLEYYPQGLFERTGNLWRAQGRRARLELKHFQRHVMTESVLHADDLEGWRGEIHDGEVTRSHDEVVRAEQDDEGDDEYADDEYAEDEYDDDYEDEGDEGGEDGEDAEDAEDEPAGEDDDADGYAEDEYDDSDAGDGGEQDEETDSDDEPEPAPRRRRRAAAGRR